MHSGWTETNHRSITILLQKYNLGAPELADTGYPIRHDPCFIPSVIKLLAAALRKLTF